jgi:F-type H+-transporting ATPase subunit b
MGYRKRVCRVLRVLAFSSILIPVTLTWAQNPISPAPTNRAASDDQTEEPKNSSSVQWLAHKLGVSTPKASGLSIGLNFVAMVTLIAVFLGPRLPVLLRNRTQAIGQALDEARKASADAKQRLAAIESSMLKLESEIAAMQSVAERESQAEEERIAASIEEEKRKIAAAGEQEILATVNQAKRDFKTYVGELAVTMAANRAQVAGSADEEILQSFIYQLGRSGSN